MNITMDKFQRIVFFQNERKRKAYDVMITAADACHEVWYRCMTFRVGSVRL